MSSKKIINFMQEIGMILYVGGIVSHIIISNLLGHSDPQTALNVYTYKEFSAYVMILPGLALKIVADIWMYKKF